MNTSLAARRRDKTEEEHGGVREEYTSTYGVKETQAYRDKHTTRNTLGAQGRTRTPEALGDAPFFASALGREHVRAQYERADPRSLHRRSHVSVDAS